MSVDPTEALSGLQDALDANYVQLKPTQLYSDLHMIVDKPNGVDQRFTYAVIERGKVQAIANLVLTSSIDGQPCFQLGCAVLASVRSRGLGRSILEKSVAEFIAGMGPHMRSDWYLEAVVAEDNAPSNAIAWRIFPDAPVRILDRNTQATSWQYLRKVIKPV